MIYNIIEKLINFIIFTKWNMQKKKNINHTDCLKAYSINFLLTADENSSLKIRILQQIK